MTTRLDAIELGYIPLLDYGFVGLKDWMGTDEAIEEAARVSYDSASTRKITETRGLLRYLMRHKHWTPFEAGVVQLHVKCPIFVARQWQRHRAASYNELSGRYSIMPDEKYKPVVVAAQSKDNKQGRAEPLSDENQQWFLDGLDSFFGQVESFYQEAIERGVARELARGVLPLNQYTEFLYKTDLRNLFGFLILRADAHAQFEIRVYADAICKLIEPMFPIAYEAFQDYMVKAVTFSREETEVLYQLFTQAGWDFSNPDTIAALPRMENKREFGELVAKLQLINTRKPTNGS